MPCAAQELVPQGPGVQAPYQGCAISGAQIGSTTVSGDNYLQVTYAYTRSHLWRNFGVVIAFTVLYILVTVIGSELFSFVGGGGGALIFKKGGKTPASTPPKSADTEKGGDAGDSSASSGQLQTSSKEDNEKSVPKTTDSESIFTWTDVNYSVPYEGGERRLLHDVHGYAKPGVMVALMGASGAGKTTLLNTLSQRQRMGSVTGNMLVDGRPLGPEFQRIVSLCFRTIFSFLGHVKMIVRFLFYLWDGRHVRIEQ